MNCEDYRQQIAADPSFDGGAAHLRDCAACQAYRDEMQALERQIGRALAIEVPELRVPELPDIDTGNVVPLRRRIVTPTWLAVAATVVVAALLGIRMLGSGVQSDSLGAEILAHLDHEPYALQVTDRPVSDSRLASVVPANVAKIDHSAGLITYAQSCVINGRVVPHLVIQGERGPVTILLMPEERISTAQELMGENINGVILPVGDGSIAIIGESGEPLEKLQQEIVRSATWTT